MCSKHSELDNAARSLGHYRVHCRHAREAVTTYRNNRKDDSKQIDVSTDDSCSLHTQKSVDFVVIVRNILSSFGAASQI